MLRFVMTDVSGTEHLTGAPITLNIRMDEGVPADDLYAVFAYTDVGELRAIRAYDDDRLLFTGVVDEQEHLFSENGRFLRISARSLAAHLLDNEAMPRVYDHPSASLIYERHVMPYGIAWADSDDATYFGEQMITKGMSEWTALKNFCTSCYSTTPRIGADGVLRMKGASSDNRIVFSDSGDGVAYLELRESKKRCEEISRVNIKVADTEGYRFMMDNTDAIERGIRRERYLNAVLTSTPMTCADAMIASGKAASYSLTLTCAGDLLHCMGNSAEVVSRQLGTLGDLYVSGLSYHLSARGDTTTVQLKRRNSICGYQDM